MPNPNLIQETLQAIIKRIEEGKIEYKMMDNYRKGHCDALDHSIAIIKEYKDTLK